MYREEDKPVVQGGSGMRKQVRDWRKEARDKRLRKGFEKEVAEEIAAMTSGQMTFDLGDDRKPAKPIKNPEERKVAEEKRRYKKPPKDGKFRRKLEKKFRH